MAPQQMIKQEDIERIVEKRVAERVAQLNRHELERIDRVEMQLAQLFTQQKAWLMVPKEHAEEAFTDIWEAKRKHIRS